MNDNEKFKDFINKIVDDNEKMFGEEAREKYGNDVIDSANIKIKKLTKAQYAEVERLSTEFNETLKAAFEQSDPTSELAQKACELHKTWLCYYWDNYSKEAHMGVSQMYVDDSRFSVYYDKIAVGCTVFLKEAIAIYCE